MSRTQDFECDGGDIVRVEYDDNEREVLKRTISASGEVREWIEYRYSRSSSLAEWKWFDRHGTLIRAFIAETRGGEIVDVKQSDDINWQIPRDAPKL
jgi:hypothetical protein